MTSRSFKGPLGAAINILVVMDGILGPLEELLCNSFEYKSSGEER